MPLNKFVDYGASFEKIITQIVHNNFPITDASSLTGPNIENFMKGNAANPPGGTKIVSLNDSYGNASKVRMVWSTSRWGGQHLVV